MPPYSRLESLPAELLLYILTRCSRKDLINLAQTRSNLRAVCRQELVNYPLAMKVTSDSLKFWVACCRKENTLLTRGARSLTILIAVMAQDLLGAVDDVDPAVFDMNARSVHPNANRILPLPSSLRKLSLSLGRMRGPRASSDTLLLFLLLRSLPERCPHLEELSIQAYFDHPSDEFDKCIRRLTRLRKLYLWGRNMPNISSRLSLLPASLTDLTLRANRIQIQEVATTVTWASGIRKIEFAGCAPQGTANVLMILSRGGASHLTELVLRENRGGADPAAVMLLQEALTVGLQEFSLIQPPLHTLSLTGPSAWSNSLHLPLLHTAVASTLRRLSLQHVDSCIFPSHLPWPCLQSLDLNDVPKMGYQGPLTAPIFPVLTTLIMDEIGEIQAPEDIFPALKTIKWQSAITPEQVASLIRHDIKRIDIFVDYDDDLCKPLWEAMGGHIIDLISLQGDFPDQINQLADRGERIFPEFPNIREFTISQL